MGSTKAADLLAVLLIQHNQPLSVERLVDCLWGEAASDGARITLRTYVGHVRRALDLTDTGSQLVSQAGGYRLVVDPELLDFEVFESGVAHGKELAGLGRHHEASAVLGHALDLWRGDVLADRQAPDFATAITARLHELRLQAWELYFDSKLATGSHAQVVGEIQAVVSKHPFRERFASQLMLALYRCGRQADALTVAATTKRQLDDELGLHAGRELRDLETAILRQDSLLDHIGVVTAPQRSAPGDPLEGTSFVGRSVERRAVRQALHESRLVTLTGLGGVGKTRLALRVAYDARTTFPDGVHIVSLDEVTQAAGVAEQLATSLGIDGWSKSSAAASVVEYLGNRLALVVLDNCEHIIDAAAAFVDRLLHSCPGIRVLTTSREPLRVAMETVVSVAPLALPGPDDEADTIDASDSVRLFLDRARTSNSQFVLDDVTRPAVVSICRELEGLPLAIELATAQLRAMSPAELAQQLRHQWRGLGRGQRSGPERQSTMASCIEWSMDLCSRPERQLWAKAAIFVGDFDFDALSAVCSGDTSPDDVSMILSSLVDKSIVSVNRFGSMTRYRMLPPIRERGLRDLDGAAEMEDLRLRHSRYYAGLVARFHRERLGPDQLHWIQVLRHAMSNIREAVEFCIEDADRSDTGLAMVGDLLYYGFLEGDLRRIRHWAERLLTAGGDAMHRAYALRTASWFATLQGDLSVAHDLLDECRPLFTDPGGDLHPDFLLVRGHLMMFSGHGGPAEDDLSQAAKRFKALGDRNGELHSLALLTMSRFTYGDLDGAVEAHRDCLEVALPARDLWARSWATYGAGTARWMQGDTAAAADLLRDSLRMKWLLGERLGVASSLEGLACLTAPINVHLSCTLMSAAHDEYEKLETGPHALPAIGEFHDDALRILREGLSAEQFEAAWQRGHALGQSSAVALALGEEVLRHSVPSGSDVESSESIA